MKTSSKLIFLVFAFLLITLVHYTTGTNDSRFYVVHVIFRNLYLVPVVFGAYWFGLKGGLVSAVVAVALFFPHVAIQWSGNTMEQASQIGTMTVLFVVGLAGGQLATMEKKLYNRALVCETTSQRRAIITSITTLEQALKVRDQYTRQHSDNTAELARELSHKLDLDQEKREDIYLAALMHDVGKIGVRDDILLKPNGLTKEEWEKIKEHPNIAQEILKPIKGVEPVVDIVRAHHENYDGSGYPRGLSGNQIPLGAQILAVADTYSALTEDRQYHEGQDFDRALQVMDTMAGKKLNPEILETFKKMIIEKCGAHD